MIQFDFRNEVQTKCTFALTLAIVFLIFNRPLLEIFLKESRKKNWD